MSKKCKEKAYEFSNGKILYIVCLKIVFPGSLEIGGQRLIFDRFSDTLKTLDSKLGKRFAVVEKNGEKYVAPPPKDNIFVDIKTRKGEIDFGMREVVDMAATSQCHIHFPEEGNIYITIKIPKGVLDAPKIIDEIDPKNTAPLVS